MQQPEKKTNTSAFLDKFRGRTNKVDKSGLTHALVSEKCIGGQEEQGTEKHRPRKLASLDARNLSQDYGRKESEGEGMHPISPEKRHLLPSLGRRGTNPNILAKAEPLPLLYSPMIPPKETPNKPIPPSRSTSDKSQYLHRRAFGKYLKLDDEAMRHFQFLLELQGKGRRSRASQRRD